MSARDVLARRFQPGVDRLLRGDFSRVVRAFQAGDQPLAPEVIRVTPVQLAIGEWDEPEAPAAGGQQTGNMDAAAPD